MRSVSCDMCKKVAEINSPLLLPPGWSDIKINGNIHDGGYLKRIFVSREICEDCLKPLIDTSKKAPKTIQQQFEEIAIAYLSDLCADAAQEAVESI